MSDEARSQEPAATNPADDDDLAHSFDMADGVSPRPGTTGSEQASAAQPDESMSADSGAPVEPVDLRKAGDADDSAASSEPATSSEPAASSEPATSRSDRHRRSGRRARKGKPRRKAPWWELPALIALAILIAIVVKSFLVQPFYIPSGSMEQTLHGCPGCSGDRILVNKLIFDFRDPHPGDIVVFNAPPGWNDEPPSTPPTNPVLRTIRGFGQLIGFVPPDGLVLVKRVIAVGGQTVEGRANGDVLVSDNGTAGPYRKLDEPFVYESGLGPAYTAAKFGPVTVPKGRLWVMGDHRDESADSRYHCNPNDQGAAEQDGSNCGRFSATVPIGNVIGKAFVIAWPPSRWRTLGTPSTFESGSAALGGAGVVPLFVVAPVWFVRRRRRMR